MRIQAILYFLAAVLLSTACEKTIVLDPGQTEELFVIEGLITNSLGKHQVKISKSQTFNTTGGALGVSDAIVSVTDDLGQTREYGEVQPGVYRAKEAFTGEIGRTYTLTIDYEDRQFTATEQMTTMGTVDTLISAVNEEEAADPEDEGRFYDLLVFMTEPQETENFYLFKFYRNGELENFEGDDVYVFDDVAIAGQLEALPAPVYYAVGDVARTEVYSLSRRAFRFYNDLANNVANDGGLFSSQPANVSTNLEGGAIGYFQVSAIDVDEMVVK